MMNLSNDKTTLAEPRFEVRGPMTIVGLGKLFNGQTRDQIPLLWQRFVKWMDDVPHQCSRTAFGVIRNNDKGNGFHYLAGVEVSSTSGLPDALQAVSLPEQRYAVFQHQGHISKLFETMCAIYQVWMPKASVELCDAPCFELYGEDFNPETGLGLLEIWIPVELESQPDA